MSELHGEKIDIIDWSDDPAQFVGNALSPAKALNVEVVDAGNRAARVTVPDFQLSLAIGREGQNARLAARLTGWRIDIRPDTDAPDAGGRSKRRSRGPGRGTSRKRRVDFLSVRRTPPVRTCVGCRKRVSSSELLRFVAIESGPDQFSVRS